MKQTELDGKKVKFLSGHPHEGETGTIIGAEHTVVGWGYKVTLDNCQHGVESCFLFSTAQGQIIDEANGRRRRTRR